MTITFNYDICEKCVFFKRLVSLHKHQNLSQYELIDKCVFTCTAEYDDHGCVIGCMIFKEIVN